MFRATDLELRRDVAVKVLPEAAASSGARRCLEAYAATVAQCQVPFHDSEVVRLGARTVRLGD